MRKRVWLVILATLFSFWCSPPASAGPPSLAQAGSPAHVHASVPDSGHPAPALPPSLHEMAERAERLSEAEGEFSIDLDDLPGAGLEAARPPSLLPRPPSSQHDACSGPSLLADGVTPYRGPPSA